MRKLFVLFGVAVVPMGCGFANVDVHPAEAPPPSPAASGPGNRREVVVVVPFADERADRGRCGVYKNKFDTVVGDVHCMQPPSEWFAAELIRELTKAGYRPLRSEDVPGFDSVVLHGAVKEVFIEPVVGKVEARFSANLVVSSPNGLHAERHFSVKGIESHVILPGGPFQAAADNASHQLAFDMVASLTELLDRRAVSEPDSGARAHEDAWTITSAARSPAVMPDAAVSAEPARPR